MSVALESGEGHKETCRCGFQLKSDKGIICVGYDPQRYSDIPTEDIVHLCIMECVGDELIIRGKILYDDW